MIRDEDFDDEEKDSDEDSKVLQESEDAQEREFYGDGQQAGENRSAEQLWLISYSDFMTIMMIFFLAMYGYTQMMNERAAPRIDRFTSLVSEMKSKMKDDVRIVEELDKITVELGEGILFKSGSADLNANAGRTLSDIGASLVKVDGDVIVEGHTDNIPISSTYRSNWELSASRAFSVIQALKGSGVPAARLAAWGFGENRPVVSNDSAENRQRNRRIDIVILKKKIKGA